MLHRKLKTENLCKVGAASVRRIRTLYHNLFRREMSQPLSSKCVAKLCRKV